MAQIVFKRRTWFGFQGRHAGHLNGRIRIETKSNIPKVKAKVSNSSTKATKCPLAARGSYVNENRKLNFQSILILSGHLCTNGHINKVTGTLAWHPMAASSNCGALFQFYTLLEASHGKRRLKV